MTRIIRHSLVLSCFTAFAAAAAHAQAPAAAGTLPLANIAPDARSAYEAGLDAQYAWLPRTAFEHMGRALAVDSTFGLARSRCRPARRLRRRCASQQHGRGCGRHP
jgi:hypothetical protein